MRMFLSSSSSSSSSLLLACCSLIITTLTTTDAFCPVVICPGFGNDAIDYKEPLKQSSDVGLVSVLERRGFNADEIYVVPIQRSDWIRVAGGLFDIPNFYTNTALPTGFGYGWYLQRVKETVELAYNSNSDDTNSKVLLIGHSAGGWLARAAMGDGVWKDDDDDDEVVRTSERIRALVTIGAIHRPPEEIKSCVTRGALAYTDKMYPGAYLKEEGIGYVSVGGNAIIGDNTKTTDQEEDPGAPARRVAYTSYEQVCGNGDGICGDGVVPLEWSLLEGSEQLSLQNVLHSINAAGTTEPTDRWYGAEKVVDQWLPNAMKEAGIQTKTTNSILDGVQNFIKTINK